MNDNATRLQRYTEKAFTAIDGGNGSFPTKSAQKEALTHLNRAYGTLRDIFTQEIAAKHLPNRQPTDNEWDEYLVVRDQTDLPFDLHQIRDRHITMMRGHNEDLGLRLLALRDARYEAKAMPIAAPKPKAEPSPYQVKAERSLLDLMKRRESQYLEAVELGKIFNGLPVSANTHLVVNQYGTEYLRTYYYLNGKLTPLNVIIAAAETLAREEA